MLSHMLTSSAAVLLLLARASRAQVPSIASPGDLAVVDAEYANSGFAANNLAGFGTPLHSTALLTVTYGSRVISNGQAYTVAQVTGMPAIAVTPSDTTAASFNASDKYTLMLADASSLGDPDSQGNYRHYLANGLTGAPGSRAGANASFSPSGGTVVTSYATPGPLAGTGPHRYAWMLFIQPATFSPPANLSSTGVAPSHWSVSAYVRATGIKLAAASFFTVQNGNPTGSVASTAAVNTASIESSASAATSTSSSSSTSGSSTTSSTAAGATNTKSSAGSLVASAATLVVGIIGVALLV